MIKVLFSAKDPNWTSYQDPLTAAFVAAGLSVDLSQDHPPADVDYIVFAPNGPVRDFTPYIKTRAVLSLWAGVETVVDNATLTQPLVRMVDDSLTAGMVEWVTGHVMRHHLEMDTHIHGQDGKWRDAAYPPLARDRIVTILGIGALGAACGQALAGLGFQVRGWARTAKAIEGIDCFHGAAGIDAALTDADFAVLLLPQTPETENVLNAARLDRMKRGSFVINPGRGPLIDDHALLSALDRGHIGHATLDVFRTEPLPADHAYWAHPKVTVTPHIASTTRPDSAARIIADQIARDQDGQPMRNVVNRRAGY